MDTVVSGAEGDIVRISIDVHSGKVLGAQRDTMMMRR